jgi:uncharacterized protein (TIGR02757 family)
MKWHYLEGTEEQKAFLDAKVDLYNRIEFIISDPISIPHQFKRKEDIEIAGLLSSTLAWGNRKMIISNAGKLVKLLENEPYNFLYSSGEKEFSRFLGFVHRTFNGEDSLFFLSAIRNIYKETGGLEETFLIGYRSEGKVKDAIQSFRQSMLHAPHFKRSEKHLPDPVAGSAAKRLNMYLRWMVRQDTSGVDFGIWKSIKPSDLMCPLDIHSGRVARELGLLTRKQDDWKAVEELTCRLREFDAQDPVKYDFALFGIGISEKRI